MESKAQIGQSVEKNSPAAQNAKGTVPPRSLTIETTMDMMWTTGRGQITVGSDEIRPTRPRSPATHLRDGKAVKGEVMC